MNEQLREGESFTHDEVSLEHEKKQQQWEAIARQVEATTDRLGYPVDGGIKETVVACNALGLTTIGSCEGHIREGKLENPYISFSAPNAPPYRYNGQEEAFAEVARKRGVPLDRIKYGEDLDAYFEALSLAAKNGESEKFLLWRAQGESVAQKTGAYLKEFYKERAAPRRVRLYLRESGGSGIWELDSVLRVELRKILMGEDNRPLGVKENLLVARQQEMKDFTRFLKEKFFDEPVVR